MRKFEFLFDFASPNCYVALAKLKEIRTRSQIYLKFSPIFLGGLFKLTNDAPIPRGTHEYNYMAKNLERLSKNLGIEFKFSHSRFPINSLKSLRGYYFARGADKEEQYIDEIFHACWGSDQDITNLQTLSEIVTSIGMESRTFLEFIEKDETKERLKTDTQSAFDRGVFGAPTFFVDGDVLGISRNAVVS